MKLDPHGSAFPVPGLCSGDEIRSWPENGISRREYFAVHAMEAMLLANYNAVAAGQVGGVVGVDDFEHKLAIDAVIVADALIGKLQKES